MKLAALPVIENLVPAEVRPELREQRPQPQIARQRLDAQPFILSERCPPAILPARTMATRPRRAPLTLTLSPQAGRGDQIGVRTTSSRWSCRS